jgi:tRNA nucleotidyltransferase (CCA-adding enzyme)
VRDELLGRPLADRDYVVVGATPQELLRRGFRPVGRDFPVFLHPETHEEYALARTERKTGRGHQGFSFHAAPGVTLEEDLARRDLTINAMARAEDGSLIDPFGGEKDLRAGILRHVGPAFAEDPLRVLRVARFAARFGFAVAPQTEALMRSIADSGELSTLTPERIWQELSRALMTAEPSRFFTVLRGCSALSQLFPEVDALFGRPRRPGADAALDAGVDCLQALDGAAAAVEPLPVRYAVLAAGLGSAARARALSNRLKVPAACRELARLTARYAAKVRRAAAFTPAALLDLLLATDALRRPERLQKLVRASILAQGSDGARGGADAVQARLEAALAVVRGVNAGALARSRGKDLPRRIRAARLQALRDWMRATRTKPAARSATRAGGRTVRARHGALKKQT